jgi:hypothetical protein
MDALRNSKKISLLAVAILFLFTFFNLILDSPHVNDNISIVLFRSTYCSKVASPFWD